MAGKSSDFYRLEKNLDENWVDVYEFHTVVNGNKYIAHHEEYKGSTHWIDRERRVTKDRGNKEYRKLMQAGYRFAGKYEMDILGVKVKKGE